MRALLLIPLLTACVYTLTVEHQQLTIDQPYDVLVIDSDAGDISVTGTSSELTSISMDKEWHGSPPQIDAVVRDDTLTLIVDCPGGVFTPCSVDLDLRVPQAVGTRLEVGAGDVHVARLAGTVLADTGSGDIVLSALRGAAEVETGSGDVVGTSLESSRLIAETGAGSIGISMAGDFNELRAESGAGDIDLLVPTGAYWMALDTGAGTVDTIGVASGGYGDPTISAHTGAGDVQVVGYLPGGVGGVSD